MRSPVKVSVNVEEGIQLSNISRSAVGSAASKRDLKEWPVRREETRRAWCPEIQVEEKCFQEGVMLNADPD